MSAYKVGDKVEVVAIKGDKYSVGEFPQLRNLVGKTGTVRSVLPHGGGWMYIVDGLTTHYYSEEWLKLAAVADGWVTRTPPQVGVYRVRDDKHCPITGYCWWSYWDGASFGWISSESAEQARQMANQMKYSSRFLRSPGSWLEGSCVPDKEERKAEGWSLGKPKEHGVYRVKEDGDKPDREWWSYWNGSEFMSRYPTERYGPQDAYGAREQHSGQDPVRTWQHSGWYPTATVADDEEQKKPRRTADGKFASNKLPMYGVVKKDNRLLLL